MGHARPLIMLVLLGALAFQPVQAEFQMNFQQETDFNTDINKWYKTYGWDVSCARPDTPNVGCWGFENMDSTYLMTPFIQEVVDTPDGKKYFHVVVGHPMYGFAQEYYIDIDREDWSGETSWGHGTPLTASVGDAHCGAQFSSAACNMSDPLGTRKGNDFSGNGSANPSRVIMRQVLGGTWDEATKTWSCQSSDGFCQEFVKGTFSQKPRIIQTVNDTAWGFSTTWDFDMGNSAYDQQVAGTMVNTLSLASVTDGSANHDFAQDKQDSYVNGGAFVYTGGVAGALPSTEPYIYQDSNFQLDQDWAAYAGDQFQYASDQCTHWKC